jgi:pimeloyl-ACP methyl ester carboxylesterase
MRRLAPLAPLLCSGCALVALYAEPLPPEAETVRARTEDGWSIALTHYRPKGAPNGLPILLCHGISSNARNMDFDQGHSLARWLAEQGRETFAVSLRGGGDSDRPEPSQGRPFGWSIDTHANSDIPAAIAKILEMTGAPKVDYVGHSMGGIIAYIYLARGGQGINSLVILGSPTRFLWGNPSEKSLKTVAGALGANMNYFDTALLAHMIAPLHGELRTIADTYLYNTENVSPSQWRKFMAVGVSGVSSGILQQFEQALDRGGLWSADGQVDYNAALAKVTVPTLVVAGKYDLTAPVPHVKAGYEALGGPKEFFIAGEENGFLHDYGHMDMVLGERAPKELWPRLWAFLQAHAPGQ